MDEERRTDEADLGGDPVCWLNRVCMECGRFAAEPGDRCAECGADLPD
ncbi:rRNA maturation endonuclease Nob1 [Pseudonocardia eucalypti]|nr:rRNA maturation endonuclease Nob1 [Pseudonocardia eucalypti]